MTKETKVLDLVLECRMVLEEMTDNARVEFFADIREGYCQFCGYVQEGPRLCQCENDE